MARNRSTHILLNIGDRLLAERTRLGITQQEMADLGSVSRPTYRLYEEGKREPSLGYIVDISDNGADFIFLMFGATDEKRISKTICLTEKSLGQLFDSVSKIIDTEFEGKIPTLFINMCKAVSESGSDSFDINALAREFRSLQS